MIIEIKWQRIGRILSKVNEKLRRYRKETRKRSEQEWKEINEDPIAFYSKWDKQEVSLPDWISERERLITMLKDRTQVEESTHYRPLNDFISEHIRSKITYLSWLIGDDFTIQAYHESDSRWLINKAHFVGSGDTGYPKSKKENK